MKTGKKSKVGMNIHAKYFLLICIIIYAFGKYGDWQNQKTYVAGLRKATQHITDFEGVETFMEGQVFNEQYSIKRAKYMTVKQGHWNAPKIYFVLELEKK